MCVDCSRRETYTFHEKYLHFIKNISNAFNVYTTGKEIPIYVLNWLAQ